VTKYSDILEVERNNSLFVSAGAGRLLSEEERRGLQAIRGDLDIGRTLLSMDEPEHQVYRRVTQDWFLPGRIAEIESDISELADAAVNRMVEFAGECDLVEDVVAPFPLRVIMRALGVPTEDEAYLAALTRCVLAPADAAVHGEAAVQAKTLCTRNVRDYFRSMRAR
jgi:cytochrome P450